MTQAAQAYGKVANQVSNQRELEAELLLTAAGQLQTIRDGWETKHAELNAALLNNRKLWSILVTSVTKPDNPLPANVRQNVANIGVFVLKHTMTTLADPRPENLGSLININRELASGLLGRA
jgi:flagellar protein FlaF